MSDKSKNQQLIFIVLLLVFILIMLPNLLKKNIAKISVNNFISADKQPEAMPTATQENKEAQTLETSIEYTGEEGKDPLSLPEIFKSTISQLFDNSQNKTNPVLPPLVVSGVVWGGSTPQAIINGKIVKEGSMFEGAEILEIKKEGVIIYYQGQEITVPIARADMSSINNLENK